jgi:hypothetical protein
MRQASPPRCSRAAARPGRRALGLAACLGCALLGAACAWYPWIPGENKKKPEPVVDPAKLSRDLALDRAYVSQADCFSSVCNQRFRVVVDRPGQLTVIASLVLESEEQQARLVLEAVSGVLAQQSTGRGRRVDPPVLAVRRPVTPGLYFVLLQTIGGRIPYELTATLTPDAGANAELAMKEVPEAPPPRPEGPPPLLTKVKKGPGAGASYDPTVRYSQYQAFAFRPFPRPGEKVPRGTPLDMPIDRQIRRFLKETLELKGFRQAEGAEQADFVVGFSRGNQSTTWYAWFYPTLYSQYDVGGVGIGPQVYTRGSLVVDIVDTRTQRIAWHSVSSRDIGPGITPGAATTKLVREGVAEAMQGFPPH